MGRRRASDMGGADAAAAGRDYERSYSPPATYAEAVRRGYNRSQFAWEEQQDQDEYRQLRREANDWGYRREEGRSRTPAELSRYINERRNAFVREYDRLRRRDARRDQRRRYGGSRRG